MRVRIKVPYFQPTKSFVSRFINLIRAEAVRANLDVTIGEIKIDTGDATWTYDTVDDFLQVEPHLGTIRGLEISFKIPQKEARGEIALGEDLAYATLAGPSDFIGVFKPAIERSVNEERQASLSLVAPATAKGEMPTTTVEESIPVRHCEMDINDLRELVSAILIQEPGQEQSVKDLRFSLRRRGLTLTEESLERLLQHPSLPERFDELHISSSAFHGPDVSVRLSRESFATSRVTVKGPTAWTSAKTERLRRFFDNHKNGDLLSRSWVAVGITSVILVFSAAFIVGLVYRRFADNLSVGGLVSVGILAAILGGVPVYIPLREFVFPGVAIGVSKPRPGLLRRATIFVLGVIAVEVLSIVLGLLANWIGS